MNKLHMTNKKFKALWGIVLLIVVSVLIEAFGFNYRYFASLDNEPIIPTIQYGSGLERVDDTTWIITDVNNAYIEMADINSNVDYIYVNAVGYTQSGEAVQTDVTLQVTDKGHALYYTLGKVSTHLQAPKTQYIRLHTYGELNNLKIYFSSTNATTLEMKDIVLNVNVPFMFSIGRCLVIFIILFMLWTFRPSSQIYQWKLLESKTKQKFIIASVIMANALFFAWLVQLNTAFVEPQWSWHQQYAMLAESLAQGRTDLMIDSIETLDNLSNPYDTQLRKQEVPDAPWDIAYYEGKFYVYFGLVPEVIFYLPYYLVTGNSFPTYIGVLISSLATLLGVFYLLKQVIKRWFPQTSVGIYLLLSFILANGMGTLQLLFCPSFYGLPVGMALAFTIWGLAFWIAATSSWKNELRNGKENRKTNILLFVGSLCLALVAGCRPQFLLGSFFCLFLFIPMLIEGGKWITKGNIIKVINFAVPYVLVAGVLMYYNYIRFDSPFDFGANYNLTTNDMTARGFELGRIPDSIFMYLLQPPNLSLVFPYVREVNYTSNYVGQVIKETMYGGALATHIFVWIVALINQAKEKLKEKKLYLWSIVMLVFALIVAVVDAQMAGLLARYYCDFLWLLMLPACMIVLQLNENNHSKKMHKYLICFLLVSLLTGFFIEFFTGFGVGYFNRYSIPEYFEIMNWFS